MVPYTSQPLPKTVLIYLCIKRIISALQRHRITNLETLKLSAGQPSYEQVNWRGRKWGPERGEGVDLYVKMALLKLFCRKSQIHYENI